MGKKYINRNYCCFVCEQNYDQLDQLKLHIISEHKEGDDYVICPSCQMPARDLLVHYRSKHIGESIPPGTQSRALIIRDIKKKEEKQKQRSLNSNKEIFILKRTTATYSLEVV